ncbi:MAG: hypothetical protein QOF48_2058 [Verrucomicrobiota bacterium]|jgi:PPK2 family polyphosphate:nucleotide phosphotransferase
MNKRRLAREFSVKPGSQVNLGKYKTDWTGTLEARKLGKESLKKQALKILTKNREALDAAQELLYASNTHSVLLIFQAMDAGGKDGTIRHVMSGVNPQGCQVYSFKKPSEEELSHTFLWRSMKCLPQRGRIGIFNRSYYEDVLVVKVHPELLSLPTDENPDRKFWEARYQDINNFEQHLARNGTLVLKFFLHVSKKEQKDRFLERLTQPSKYWKFSPQDMTERGFWKQYQRAYEEAIAATSTRWAPWFIIPADRKFVTRALVADIIVGAISRLRLQYPSVSREMKSAILTARKELEGNAPAAGKNRRRRARKDIPRGRIPHVG